MTKKIGRSLFEYLGIADQERIHTQTLAWLLSPKDSPFNQDQIRYMFNKLFNYEISNFDEISVSTEYKNIDLLIRDDNQAVGVENKMKSKQSKDQLEGYKATLDKICFSNKLYFLTFSGETAEAVNNLDYQMIHDVLHDALQLGMDKNKYVVDYVLLLNKMLAARKYFLEESAPEERNEVNERSGKKTEDRINSTIKSGSPHIKFICDNRLERLFIEIYYRTIMTKLNLDQKAYEIEITESNGRALIQVRFKEFEFVLESEGKLVKFLPGFQFQNGTIKYNIAPPKKDYSESKLEDLTQNFSHYLDYEFNNSSQDYKYKINPAKTKAYRSYSFSLESSKLLLEKKFSEVCEFFESEIPKCENTWRVVWQNWQKSNSECNH